VRRTSDALDHLRHAIEMSEEFRDSAKDDSDLDPIRDDIYDICGFYGPGLLVHTFTSEAPGAGSSIDN